MTCTIKLRRYIATTLTHALRETGTTYTGITQATDIPFEQVYNAVKHGIGETADIALICGHLGIEPGPFFASALAHAEPASPENYDRPWCLHTPPASRYVEIHIHGTELLAQYLADRQAYLIGHDALIPSTQVPRWREATPEQLDRLNQLLTDQCLPA